MKKFTSLFALLAGLCVVSAQADVVTIYVDASTVTNPRYWYWGTTSDPSNFSERPYINDLPTQVINGITFHKLELTPKDNNNNNKVSVKFTNGDNEGQTNEIGNLSAPNSYYYTYKGNDSYSVPVVTLGISSSADNWASVNPIFDYQGDNTWTCIWDLSNVTQNVDFKLRPNLVYYAGNSNNTINAAEGWVGGDDNITLNHPSTGCKKYQITAQWNTNIYTENGWTIDIKGILELTDDVQFNTNSDFTAASASYSRNISNQWGTLCLPFGFKVSDQQLATQSVSFYYLPAEGGIDAKKRSINFTRYENNVVIDPGEAVLFKLLDSPEGRLHIRATGGVEVVSEPIDEHDAYNRMVGTFEGTVINEGEVVYYISSGNFYYGTNITVNPFRAYIVGELPDESEAEGAPFRISIGDTEDIQFVEQEDGTVKAYYDLQGRKLDSARKGLVIENGKIIMVK